MSTPSWLHSRAFGQLPCDGPGWSPEDAQKAGHFLRRGWCCLLLACFACGCSSPTLSVAPRPDGEHFAAIYAAGLVEQGRDRNALLVELASRSALTGPEQVYLLEVLRDAGGTSSQKTAVLLALLRNPAVTHTTRARMSEILLDLDLTSRDAGDVAVAMAFPCIRAK